MNTCELTEQQVLEVACKKIVRHRNYMKKIWEVMTVNDLLANMDFLGQVYKMEAYLTEEVGRLRAKGVNL